MVLIGRHDGCSATHITSTIDPRDRPYILGTDGQQVTTLDEAVRAALPDQFDNFQQRSRNMTVSDAVDVAREIAPDFYWSCDKVRTPEGWYRYRGGSEATIARALVVAPYVDVSWACMGYYDAEQAKEYAAAVQAAYPGKWMAYNFTGAFGKNGKSARGSADVRSSGSRDQSVAARAGQDGLCLAVPPNSWNDGDWCRHKGRLYCHSRARCPRLSRNSIATGCRRTSSIG